ncbi:MAG: four helix bundle protein [Deltaproteobacteria bacterium]|nr:four helix bundle protein [Kofleriaceae bacterium]
MFKAHGIAMQLIAAVRPIVEVVMPRDKDLAGQLRRAATSAAANTAEGGRRVGGDRLHSFRIASGEAAETLSWSRIAVAWGYAPESAIERVRAVEDELQAVLWRLQHPRR